MGSQLGPTTLTAEEGQTTSALWGTPSTIPRVLLRNYGGSLLYGSEYEIVPGQALNSGMRHNHDAPCAVCYVSTRLAQVMIPGTYQCPAGWTVEYSGWLMSKHYTHKGRTTYTCVDKDPEVIPGQQRGTDGALFYHTETTCDALPCPPYDERKELSCVVCTKWNTNRLSSALHLQVTRYTHIITSSIY